MGRSVSCFAMPFAPDCEDQASLLEEVPAQGQSRLGKPLFLALSSISACAFVVGWARSGAASRIAIDGLMSKSESECPQNGQDCSASKCCSEWGATCYKKDDHWSSCNATCNPYYKWYNNQWNKEDEKIWDCTPLSTPPCTHDGQDCSASKCCVSPGSTCYKKNEYWSSCNATCTANWKWVDNHWQEQGKDEKIWACDVVGDDDNGDDSGDHDGFDTTCIAKAEEECLGVSRRRRGQGCRQEERIDCCKEKTGKNATECCGIEGVPNFVEECGGNGDEDETCKLQAETACMGCSGLGCLTCLQEEEINCCLDTTCEADCKTEENGTTEDNGTDEISTRRRRRRRRARRMLSQDETASNDTNETNDTKLNDTNETNDTELNDTNGTNGTEATCVAACKRNAQKRMTCCAKQGVPTHEPICKATTA